MSNLTSVSNGENGSSNDSISMQAVAADAISLIAPLIYAPMGIIGNVLSVLVYKHQWTHVDWRPFLTFLIILSFIDTFYLTFCTPLWWLLGQYSFSSVCILTKIASYLSNVINFLDVWIIVIMSFYRLRMMMIPSSKQVKLSTRHVIILSIMTIFFSFCLNLHILFALSNEYDSYGQRCPLFVNFEFWYTKVWRWLSLLLNSGIPGIVVIVINSMIIHKMQKAKENLYSISDHQHQHDQHATHKRHLRERMMTASLLTLSFGVIALTAPYLIFKILVDPPLVQVANDVSSLLRQLLVNILCLRYAFNVFAFLLASVAFRQDLKRMLKLRCNES